MAWDKEYPQLTTNISASVIQIVDNWEAIAEVFSGEHAGLDSALSGTHLYGRVSTMFSGTLAQISALSGPASGALAYDTECGVLRIYSGSTWPRITGTYFSRFHAIGGNQAISSGTWTTVILDTESYDSLAEFNPATGAMDIEADGYYLVIGTIQWEAAVGTNFQKAAGLYTPDTSTRVALDVKYGGEEPYTIVADIINIGASDSLYLRAYQNSGVAANIIASSVILTRLS